MLTVLHKTRAVTITALGLFTDPACSNKIDRVTQLNLFYLTLVETSQLRVSCRYPASSGSAILVVLDVRAKQADSYRLLLNSSC